MALIASLCCLFGCGNSNGNQSPALSKVTFIDKGSIVQYPTTTTITIDATSATTTESQAGVVFGSITKAISFEDYTSMRRIINDKSIMTTGDVTLTPADQGCTGWSGMTIIVEGVDKHTLNIDGAVCDMAKWPAGVRDLTTFKNKLVGNYFCSNPVPVSGQLIQISPRYIMYFKSGVNAVTETNRLMALYGFTPSSIWDAIGGFSADLSPSVLESLRCEPTIQSIFFNGLTSLN